MCHFIVVYYFVFPRGHTCPVFDNAFLTRYREDIIFQICPVSLLLFLRNKETMFVVARKIYEITQISSHVVSTLNYFLIECFEKRTRKQYDYKLKFF